MKVLFVTYDFPFPITSGGKNRAFNLIKHCAKDADIYLFSFVRDDFHSDFLDELNKIGVRKTNVHKRKKLSNLLNFPETILKNSSIFKTLYFENEVVLKLKEIINEEEIDLVHFESSYTGFYINSDISRMHVKKVLGTENIEFMLYEEYAASQNIIKRPLISYQAGQLKKEELLMVRNADAVTAVTQKETEILEALTGKKCSIVSNGIDPDEFPYKFEERLKNNILFVGNFTYFPNVEAVNFFYENVFEKLDSKITLTIVGKKAEQTFRFNNHRIIIKDFVEDIISEYRNADMLVFPIKVGGGTNFKVLEAMSLGVPIVAYPERLAGLNAVSEEHFLEALRGEEFVNQIERLYKDLPLREKITKKSRILIEENYAWDNIAKDLIKVWRNVL